LGFAALALLQIALSTPLILALHAPEPGELACGAGATLAAIALVGAVGQSLGLRFARALSADAVGGGLSAPMLLAAFAVALGAATALDLAFALGWWLGDASGAAIAVFVLFGATLGAYLMWLPRLGARLEDETERLVDAMR